MKSLARLTQLGNVPMAAKLNCFSIENMNNPLTVTSSYYLLVRNKCNLIISLYSKLFSRDQKRPNVLANPSHLARIWNYRVYIHILNCISFPNYKTEAAKMHINELSKQIIGGL